MVRILVQTWRKIVKILPKQIQNPGFFTLTLVSILCIIVFRLGLLAQLVRAEDS